MSAPREVELERFGRARTEAAELGRCLPGATEVAAGDDDRGAGRIVVDGPLCDEYYTVSRIVRDAFALV